MLILWGCACMGRKGTCHSWWWWPKFVQFLGHIWLPPGNISSPPPLSGWSCEVMRASRPCATYTQNRNLPPLTMVLPNLSASWCMLHFLPQANPISDVHTGGALDKCKQNNSLSLVNSFIFFSHSPHVSVRARQSSGCQHSQTGSLPWVGCYLAVGLFNAPGIKCIPEGKSCISSRCSMKGQGAVSPTFSLLCRLWSSGLKVWKRISAEMSWSSPWCSNWLRDWSELNCPKPFQNTSWMCHKVLVPSSVLKRSVWILAETVIANRRDEINKLTLLFLIWRLNVDA